MVNNKPSVTKHKRVCVCLFVSVVLGGLYSGDVVVWDTSKSQDSLMAQTGMSAQSHREPVYQAS